MLKYLEPLVDLQISDGILVANKLKRRHLQWMQEKLTVKLEAQLFRKSVCDALICLFAMF